MLYINHSGKYIEINFNMKIPFLIFKHVSVCSDDECDGNPMVSGFQVDLDPEDLNLGSNLTMPTDVPKDDDEEDGDDDNFDSPKNCYNETLASNAFHQKDVRRKLSDSSKRNAISHGLSEVSDLNSQVFPSESSVTLSASTASPVLDFAQDGDDKMENLDDWLSSKPSTIANPYVSTNNDMPDGALEDSDEEGESIMLQVCNF